MKNLLNCQTLWVKKGGTKMVTIFSHFIKILCFVLKYMFFLTFDVEKLRTIILDIAKIHKL